MSSREKGPTRWEWMKAVLSENGPVGRTGSRGDRDVVAGPIVRFALAALGQHMDPSGESCFPSIPLLAQETSLGESTVRRALQQAETEGWIRREPRGRGYLYIPVIPPAPDGVAVPRSRPPRAESNGKSRASKPPAPDGVPIPPAPATVPAPDGDLRPPRAPSSTREVGDYQEPSTDSPVDSTFPPSSGSTRRGGKGSRTDGPLRAALIEHALLGHEEATTSHGESLGIGLLLIQARELIDHGVDGELLAAMIPLVRSDEEAPPPDEPFSLRWLREEPARFSRLEARVMAALASTPTEAALVATARAMPSRNGGEELAWYHEQPEDVQARCRAEAERVVRGMGRKPTDREVAAIRTAAIRKVREVREVLDA